MTTTNGSNDGLSKKAKRIQIITPNSSPPQQAAVPVTAAAASHQPNQKSSIKLRQRDGVQRMEWVVLPVFIDIVKLALKVREDCSTR